MKPVPKKIMDELRAAQGKYIASDSNWEGTPSSNKQSLTNIVEFWDCEINKLTPENPKLAAFDGAIGGSVGTALGSWVWYGISGLNAVPLVLAGGALTAAILYHIVKYENAQIRNLYPRLQAPAEQEFAKVQGIVEKYVPELMEE